MHHLFFVQRRLFGQFDSFIKVCKNFNYRKASQSDIIRSLKALSPSEIWLRNDHEAVVLSYTLIGMQNQKAMSKLISRPLEQYLKENLLSFPDNVQQRIIQNLHRASKKGNKLGSLRSLILESAEYLVITKQFFDPALLLTLSTMKETSKIFEFVSRELMVRSNLDSFDIKDLNKLLLSYMNRKKYLKTDVPVNKHGNNILTEMKEVITPKLRDNIEIEDLYYTLISYVYLDQGTEDFRRFLESLFFPRLNELPDDLFVSLPSIYQRRIVFDYKYMMNNIWKNVYEEMLARFFKFSPSDLKTMIFKMWFCSGRYGQYADNRMIKAISDLIQDKEAFKALGPEIPDVTTNIMGYLTNTGYFDDKKLLEDLYELTREEKFTPDNLLRLGSYYSRHNVQLIDFWKQFLASLPKMMDKQSFPYLFSIYINLKLSKHPLFEDLETALAHDLPAIQQAWHEQRKGEVDSQKQGFFHEMIEKVLQKRGIKYEKEYYDHYFIDLAIPSKKLAIEVCGPNHYTFPNTQLDGKTQTKVKNLELLGWKVMVAHFFTLRPHIIEKQVLSMMSGKNPLKY